MKLLKVAVHGNLKPSCSYEERKVANFMHSLKSELVTPIVHGRIPFSDSGLYVYILRRHICVQCTKK